MCVGMCVDMYVDVCLEMLRGAFVDMCVDMCMDRCMDMCIHTFSDMLAGRCAGVCLDMCIEMCNMDATQVSSLTRASTLLGRLTLFGTQLCWMNVAHGCHMRIDCARLHSNCTATVQR